MKYRIKEIREKKKLTQEQLAEKSGISRVTIIRLENEENVETQMGTLKAIADALSVPVTRLIVQ